MRALLILAFIGTVPAYATASASPDLVALEKELAAEREAFDTGKKSAEDQRSFIDVFRPRWEAAAANSPKTPANEALNARILAQLGERDAAVTSLTKALEAHPGDATLTMALGQTYLDGGDYQSALAEAEKILESDPKHEGALLLKHSSAGRVSTTAGRSGEPAPSSSSGLRSADSPGVGFVYTQARKKAGTRNTHCAGDSRRRQRAWRSDDG